MEMSAIAAHLYAMAPAVTVTVTKITLATSPRAKITTNACVASRMQMPDLQSPSQLMPVPNYTAW